MIINLSKNNNFSISGATAGGVTLNAFDGKALYSTQVDSVQGEKTVIGIADEIFTLYDGKILKRIKDNLYLV